MGSFRGTARGGPRGGNPVGRPRSDKLQVQSGETHLVAEQLWLPEVPVPPQETRSRDFH